MLVFIICTFNYSVIDAKSTRPSVMWNGKLFNISQDCYSEKYWYKPPFRSAFDIEGLVVKNNTTGEVFRLFMQSNYSTIVYVNDHYEAIGTTPYEARLYSVDEFEQPYTSDVSFNPYSPYGTYSVIGIADSEYAGVDPIYEYLTLLKRYNPTAYSAMLADPITNPGGGDLQKWYNLLREYNLEHVAVNPEVLTIDEYEEFNVWREARLDYYDEIYHMTNGDSWYMPPEVQELLKSDENAYKQMLYARRVTAVSGD